MTRMQLARRPRRVRHGERSSLKKPTGKGPKPRGTALRVYPVRVVNARIEIDLG